VRGICVIAPLAISVTFSVLSAQVSTRNITACDGLVISSIAIAPRGPQYPRVPSRAGTWLIRFLEAPNTTTSARVIDRFLLVEVGQVCTERQRGESERILRLQPFLADATVRAIADGAGGVSIEVETVDELPTVFETRFRGPRPSFLRLGNGNVGGQGLYLALGAQRGFAYRTGWQVRGVAYQVLGRPYTLSVVAERAPIGSTLAVGLGYPFLTDLQRSAWHMGYADVDRLEPFSRPDEDAFALGVRRRFWSLGAVHRLGESPRSIFLGALVSGEDVRPAESPVTVSDSGLVPLSDALLGGQVPAYHNVRLNAVVGARALRFVTVRGFDALMGVQDVAIGVQLVALVGRSIPRFGSVDDELFVSADLYSGLGSSRSFAALQVEVEARKDRRAARWGGMVGNGRLAWYVKPTAAHVLIGSVEAAAGWRGRVPFQLTLGDRQGGVRGYGASRVAGAVRTVARIEERWVLGGLTDRDALGLAGFVDAGRVWAGDAPFGVDSDTQIGVGFGLLAAFPPQSQRLWRLDLALPVGRDPYAHWEIRVSSVWTLDFRRAPDDVARVRAGASPSKIFTWW
jgi:hypothetical protein